MPMADQIKFKKMNQFNLIKLIEPNERDRPNRVKKQSILPFKFDFQFSESSIFVAMAVTPNQNLLI